MKTLLATLLRRAIGLISWFSNRVLKVADIIDPPRRMPLEMNGLYDEIERRRIQHLGDPFDLKVGDPLPVKAASLQGWLSRAIGRTRSR